MIKTLIDKGADIRLAELIFEMADAVREISLAIIMTSAGKIGTQNAFGEEQAVMDIKAEEIMHAHLRTCPFVAAFSSEESDSLERVNYEGCFSVFYDPLDGSSLLDVNGVVGTIIGIYESKDAIGMKAGDQIAALYAQYGPRTTLVLTFGNGVMEFTLKEEVWELTSENICISEGNKYFAPGNLRACGDRRDYYDLVKFYIENKYTLRYSGGMVPDINHILKKGSGIFMYPADIEKPNGKLRLLYECAPMAFIVEQAGGLASNGKIPILDMTIDSLLQTTPIFIGSAKQVESALERLS